MIFCTGCGKQLHETAFVCPQCGKPQNAVAATQPASASSMRAETLAGPLWAAITSLALGGVSVLALCDDAEWDNDTAMGFMLFAVVSLVLGIVSLNISKRGKGMAIAGIVMSALGLIGFLSS